MPKTEYTLNDNLPIVESTTASRFYFILRHDNATLDIPAADMILDIDELVEHVDLTGGLIQMPNVQIVFQEDYSDYAGGFWNTIIDDATIGDDKLELRIGYGSTDYEDTIFWGVLEPYSSNMNEDYVSGDSSHIRAVRLLFVDMLSVLKTVKMDDLVTTILANDTLFASELGGGGNLHFILVTDMVACMLVNAYGQTFATGDVTCGAPDEIEYFGDTEAAWHGLDEVYVYTDTGYFLSSDTDNYIALRYQTAMDFLTAICRNFGVVARRVNDASGEHQIELLARGDNYGTTITLGDLVDSPEVGFATRERPVLVHVGMENNAEDFAAWFDGVGNYSRANPSGTDGFGYRRNTPNYILSGATKIEKTRTQNNRNTILASRNTKEPLNISWDFQVDLLWMANEDGTLSHASRHIHTLLFVYDSGATTMRPADTTRYYDHIAEATATAENYGDEALCKYYHYRFSPGRRSVQRTYLGLEATESAVTSFLNVKPFKRIAINDGLKSATFYATKVSKNLKTCMTTILWVEE